jgi:hypothetical protein
MNQIVPFHGNAVALATGGRLNVAAMVKHYLAPFESAVPFEAVIEAVKRNSTPGRRRKNEAPSAAIAIRKVVSTHVKASIRKAQHYLGIAMLAPDEADVRQIIGVMFGAFHAEPTPASEFFVDMLVMELMQPVVGDRFCLPAIAAAARECWQTLASPPAISEFLALARKRQARLDAVFKQLGDVLEASSWADDLIEPDRPVDESDEDYIPIEA